MPIFYNFYILLATFYTIFGTNILIQCPVPVPVFCMFFVSQKIHIKRSPNGIKTDGDFFWNICDFREEESTRYDARGGPQGRGRTLDPRGHPVRRLVPSSAARNPISGYKLISTQLELRISWNIRNGERPESKTQKPRETERQIQSRRGSRPSHAMETMDQRGNPSPI